MYLTAVGYRTYPTLDEFSAIATGEQTTLKNIEPVDIEHYPVLVTIDICPFTSNAGEFWEKAAQAAKATLHHVSVDSEEGQGVVAGSIIRGVPCLLAGPDKRVYGLQLSPEEAIAFLE